MKKMTIITIGLALLLACQIHGAILYRATFGYLKSNNPSTPSPEDVEGLTWDNWSANSSIPSLIQPKEENDVDPFQTQSHGRFSLYLKDLDSTINYAMATSDTFHNDNDEYLIEFWFYHPGDGVKFYNGYPICRPLRITCGDTVQTDVQLWLKQDAFGIPMTHIIAQTQAETLYVDFTLIADHWVKLQLHRHDGQVDIYVMSELKGTLAADNPTQKTNCLRIGTTEPQFQGEAYWDDFIVTSVPQGVHPRLYFTPVELQGLKERAASTAPTVLGKNYKQLYEEIRDSANYFMAEGSGRRDFTTWWGGATTFIYPYYEPAPHATNLITWGHAGQLMIPSRVENVAMAAAITDSAKYIDWLKPVLRAFSTWQQWTDPNFRHGNYYYAYPHDIGHFTQTIAFAYDILFDRLTNYDKMNAQNAIVTLGVQPLNYQFFKVSEGPDYWAVGKAGAAIGSMVLDPPLAQIAGNARVKLEAEIINNTKILDPHGQVAPNGHYGYFLLASTFKYIEAAARCGLSYPDYYASPFVSNYADGIAHWLILRGNQIIEPPFYNHLGMAYNNPSTVYLIAGKRNNPYAQMLGSKWPWPNYRGYVPWCRLVWFNASVDTARPAEDIPRSMAFRDVGYTVLGTGWGADDPVIYLKSGPRPSGHDHNDLNSFVWFGKNGWLLSEWYDQNNPASQATSSHSTILVDGEGQMPFSYNGWSNWAARQRGYMSDPYIDTNYCYVSARAESLYIIMDGSTNLKLSLYKRELLFDMGVNALLVNDRIIAKEQARNIDWLLACNNRAISGDSVAIWNGNDTLCCKLLMPTGVTIIPTSLPCTDAGTPIFDTSATTELQAPMPGIKVDPNPLDTNVMYARYLSVYYPSQNNSVRPVVRAIANGKMHGAAVDDHYLLYCDSMQQIDTASYYTNSFGAIVNTIAGLQPNTAYRLLMVDSSNNHCIKVIDTLTTSSGTVHFTFEAQTTVKVIVTTDLSSPHGSINLDQYTNFKYVSIQTPAQYPYAAIDSVSVRQKYWVNDEPANPLSDYGHWGIEDYGWMPFQGSTVCLLHQSAVNRPNVFDVQYKVGMTLTSATYTDQIYFNDVEPVAGSIIVNNGGTYANDPVVHVAIDGGDAFPGLSQMRYSESPFGCSSGYVNVINNGTFVDTVAWSLDHATITDGMAHLSRSNNPPVVWGSSIVQPIIAIPGPGLVRISADLVCQVYQGAFLTVNCEYGDSLLPSSKVLWQHQLPQDIVGVPSLYSGANSLSDTFRIPEGRQIASLVFSISLPGVIRPPHLGLDGIDPDPIQPPSQPPSNLYSSSITIDNIRLEPVEVRLFADGFPHLYDGWQTVDTASALPYTLSDGDGPKVVYAQLMDHCGNISAEPGWSASITLDMVNPYDAVVSPSNGSYISSLVRIKGLAWDNIDSHFQSWALEYKLQGGENWNAMTSGSTPLHYLPPKIPPTIYTWNTELVSDGMYLLRLTSWDKAGNIAADTHVVYVSNGPTLPPEAITADFVTFNCLPVDADCDQTGNIHITDTQANKIWEYSPEGDSVQCFGYRSTGQDTVGFNQPVGIAVDDSGFIWVADCYNAKIKKFAPTGTLALSFGDHGSGPGEFNQPTGIAVRAGNVFVTDKQNNRVQRFDRNGCYIGQFGQSVLLQPTGIAVKTLTIDTTVTERYNVSDSKHNRIVVFDTSGAVTDSIAGLGLNEPWDVVPDVNDNLFIADAHNDRIVMLDPWGGMLLTFGGTGQNPGQFRLPQGLAVSPDGQYLYVVDTHNNRVQRFRMTIFTGGFNLSARRRGPDAALPQYVFELGQSRPNPFNQRTQIKYQLPGRTQVSLKIYNIGGQLVKTLENTPQDAGLHTVEWNGCDDYGKNVAAGVYLYRLQAGGRSDTRKIVLVR